MKFVLLFLFPAFIIAQPCRKLYKDKLEPNSKLISCDIMHTVEKLEDGSYVYKMYYPDTRQIIKYISYKDKNLKIKHGPFKEYWDDGTLWNEGQYIDNQKEGAWIENMNNKGNYKNNEKDGMWKMYRKDGSLQFERNYRLGEPHGISAEFDSTGVIKFEDVFDNGKLVATLRDTTIKNTETRPRFPGCEDQILTEEEKNDCAGKLMLTWIYSRIKYPASARFDGIQGQAISRFVVDKSGLITDIEIINGVSEAIKKEVHLILSSMPTWRPGYQNGKPVKVMFTLPISFRLE